MPESQVSLHRLGLDWDGVITPTPLSRSYRIHITYRPSAPPAVTVTEPRLQTRQDEPLPHTFEISPNPVDGGRVVRRRPLTGRSSFGLGFRL